MEIVRYRLWGKRLVNIVYNDANCIIEMYGAEYYVQ